MVIGVLINALRYAASSWGKYRIRWRQIVSKTSWESSDLTSDVITDHTWIDSQAMVKRIICKIVIWARFDNIERNSRSIRAFEKSKHGGISNWRQTVLSMQSELPTSFIFAYLQHSFCALKKRTIAPLFFKQLSSVFFLHHQSWRIRSVLIFLKDTQAYVR